MSETSTNYQAVFQCEEVDPSVARVRSVSTREALNTSFAAEVEIEVSGASVDPHAWITRHASVAIVSVHDGAILRRLSGVVTRVLERATARGDRQRVAVTVESLLSVLKLVTDYRIFQEMTSLDIARTLLEEAGLSGSQVALRATGSYAKREVCTQFGETSFDFLSRVLEEDGIFYFFEFTEEGPVVVIADGASALAASSTDEVPFRRVAGLHAGQSVSAVTEVEAIRPAKVTLRDHDFKKPSLDLTASAKDEAPLGREYYDYPGRYSDPGEGQRRAQALLDAHKHSAQTVRFEGNVASLLPGHTFKLVDAPSPDLEKEWVVTALEQTWEDRGEVALRSTVTAVASHSPLRPLKKTRRGLLPGPQIAKVRGPAGSEIHCDEFGRVKVSFVWDRRSTQDEKSSAWVRVGQMFMGGAVAIPRVGWEVLVDFEDGDPDKPVVVGRLYNAVFAPPYKLPDSKTMSALQSFTTPGGGGTNEIRMEDGAGGEQVMVHAQKDMNLVVANNRTEKITTNEGRVVGSNQTVSIGANQTVDIGAASELGLAGSQTWTVGASRTKSVSSDEKLEVKGSRTLVIGGSHTRLTPMSVSTTSAGSLSETVGGSNIEAAVLSVSTNVAGAASVTVGAVKIEAAASGKSETTVGAHATTVGGALITAAGGDINVGVGGAKATTVGGAWAGAAGGDVQITASSAISVLVGGAVAFNAGKIVLEVGGSNVTVSAGSVSIKSSTIKLTATGPHAELAPMVEDK